MSLLIGIVIGTAIFRMPGAVFRSVHSPLEAFGLWVAGALLSFAGALCYAELAAAYPRSGGDYEYLSRAYGRWLGLQFAWSQWLVVLTGSVGSMAYAFADYTRTFWTLPAVAGTPLALAAIAALTAANLLGMRVGKTAQNLLTLTKLAGLAAIVMLALRGEHWGDLRTLDATAPRSIGLAMVFVLYAYSGWTHAAYVAAEVDRPQRNLPRSLLVGVAAVTVVYLVVNAAYLVVLGFSGARASETPAFDAVRLSAGPDAARLVALLVMLSALGAINGTILTGAHLLRELGRDYPQLNWLCGANSPSETPVRALLGLAAASIVLVLSVGTETGQRGIDLGLQALQLPAIPWATYSGGFETLVAAAAPLFWLYLLLTGTTVFVLRQIDPTRSRPFRVPGYPVTLLAFVGASGYMLWSSVAWAGGLTLIALLPIVTAAVISWHATAICRRSV